MSEERPRRLKDYGLVLVTGASGFIGSQLCRALAGEGLRVRAFHRSSSSLVNLEGLAVEHAVGDINRPETLAEAMQGVEAVFHTAALLGWPRDPREMYAVTVEGTRNVLAAAREAGVRRVVHTSSVAALGVPDGPRGGQPLLMDERHTWNFRPEWWRYGHAKYLAEMAVQEAVALGQDIVMVNPAVVLGPGDLNRVSGGILVKVAQRKVPVGAPGGLNVVHIEDVVRGHLAALSQGATGERYILGGENLPHMRFLQMAAEAAGVPAPRLAVPGGLARRLSTPVSLARRWLPLPVSGDALHRIGLYFYYDTTKARNALGLGDSLPARQAIVDAYTWFREHGIL